MADKKRAIFEEVATTEKARAAQPGAIDRGGQGGRRALRLWLMMLFALVVLMIAVGGLTRLTDSGLSITEWAPLSGAIPPMNAADWEAEFALYRAIPEYQLQNAGMTLAEFKVIYWWEWGHRQLGRIIGLVWGVGLLILWLSGKVPKGRDGRPAILLFWVITLSAAGYAAVEAFGGVTLLEGQTEAIVIWAALTAAALALAWFVTGPSDWLPKFLFLGALGGIQGGIGWWMVSSGLEEGMLDVASYRLALHLGLAFAILGLIAWYTLVLGRRDGDLLQARRAGDYRLYSSTTGLMHFAFLQILLGALVAGIDAGRAFPTWPLMGDGVLPPDPFQLTPLWRNFFEDAGLVQFIHRTSGYLLVLFAVVVWRRARRSPHPRTRFAFNAMLAVMVLQIVIGIVTVLYQAPWQIAIVHQLTAVLLWVLIIRGRFLARYPLQQSVREGLRLPLMTSSWTMPVRRGPWNRSRAGSAGIRRQ